MSLGRLRRPEANRATLFRKAPPDFLYTRCVLVGPKESVNAMKRRTFIETSLATAAIAAAPRSLSGAMPGMPHHIQPIGLQLYTVHNLMKTDFDGTIAGVAKVGYKEVEFAGYDGKTPKEVRAVLDKNGLKAPGENLPYKKIENKWPETLEAAN